MMSTPRFKGFARTGAIVAVLWSSTSQAEDPLGPEEKAVIHAYNETALQLYRELSDESENLVISPYSIGTAMAMVLSGAGGDTETEMAKTLNHALPKTSIDSANSKLLDKMERHENRKGIVLSMANALCLTGAGHLTSENYKDVLRARYRAELFETGDVAPINAWVSKKTHGKIDEILKQLSANSVCVLLNAIYFKGPWASRFDEKLTNPETFHLAENETTSVPMMRQTTKYALTERENFTALAMPYKGDVLALVILLPKARMGLPDVEKTLSIDLLGNILDDLESVPPEKVALVMPKFKMAFDANLIPAFQALGMKSAFSPKEADFSGITGREEPGLIWIAQIKHKAFIEVNEEGSEAAAATAVEMKTRSAPRITEFRADHPFLFLLVDRSADAILFMGRVKNPLKEN